MDFFWYRLVGPGYPKFRGDDDASKLGEHVRGRRMGLGRVAGGAGAAAGDIGAVVSGGGIPADGDGLAGELEREGALDGAGCTSSNTYAL